MPVDNSRIQGFYNQSISERRDIVSKLTGLSDDESSAYLPGNGLSIEKADHMIENVIGTLSLPVGIATNFIIDNHEYIIPFCVEESSIVAAASNIAKRCRSTGGFRTSVDEPIMIGQLQILDIVDIDKARLSLLQHKEDIILQCNDIESKMIAMGGGCKDIEVNIIPHNDTNMIVLHILVDCRDAMGANAVNSMAERIAPFVEQITNGRVHLKILSNLATHRLARAEATFLPEELSLDGTVESGKEVIDGIIEAYCFARDDPHRAATHNKGIMNAISSIALACGQDWRAIEAGCHAYAAFKSGTYSSMTSWEVDMDGRLIGTIEVPIAVGIVGGASKVHPVAMANLKILGITSAQQLAGIMASAGLAQNLGAMRALATDGIQKGHMKLHAKNMAITSGAEEHEIGPLVMKINEQKGQITQSLVNELLSNLRAAH